MEKTIVSFPGLGIDPLNLNKIAFSIGSVSVRWYGILVTLAIITAFLYAIHRAKKSEHIVPDDILDVGILTVILGVIGARAYYVLTTLNEIEYKTFYDVIAIWNGGIAIYGGIIGGILGIVLVCDFKKLKVSRVLDAIAPGVILAQAIGRWGNFFNGEAYGYEIADTTKFFFFNHEYTIASGEGTIFNALRMGLGDGFFYHPTFFYECVWCLIGFLVLSLLYTRKKFDGQIVLSYLAWYGFGRMFIEGLRTDSLYLGNTNVRISQLLGMLCFLICMIVLLCRYFKRPRKCRTILPTVADEPRVYTRELTDEEKAAIYEKQIADVDALTEEKLNATVAALDETVTLPEPKPIPEAQIEMPAPGEFEIKKSEEPAPAEEVPAEEKPVEAAPAEEKSAEEKPVEEARAEEKPAEENHGAEN